MFATTSCTLPQCYQKPDVCDHSMHSTKVIPNLMLHQVLGFCSYCCLLWPMFLLAALCNAEENADAVAIIATS